MGLNRILPKPICSLFNIEMKTLLYTSFQKYLYKTSVNFESLVHMKYRSAWKIIFFYLKNKLFSIVSIKLPGQHRKLRGRIRT